MIRLTPPKPVTALLLAVLAGPAVAQTPAIPDITAEAWPHPVGDHLPLRVIMTDAVRARHYSEGSRVHGGVLKVDYRISCEGDDCPAPTLRTGTTVIPCGQQEGGVLHYRIAHLRGRGELTIRLHITGIRFEPWRQEWIDRANARHSPWPNGDPACAEGTYSPARASTGSHWTSTPATVR